jgi:hypothetical protein
LRHPDLLYNRLIDGGSVVNLELLLAALYLPRKILGTHFCTHFWVHPRAIARLEKCVVEKPMLMSCNYTEQ